MPLLKKKTFEKASAPQYLRDDEEVFYCAITNEIFKDYEEFSERMFLVNSMVWTCSMTGKSNLTYTEALESEENAKRSLKEFPSELKVPVLYLANQTQRTSFGDMADDVFNYTKDRYFIGENVETSFMGAKWKDSHVLQIVVPTDTQMNSMTNGNTSDQQPPASLYKYEIEHLDAYDSDISEIMIVDCNQIRRKKGLYSREKCKLFLKQHVEQDDKGVFVIKKSSVVEFKLDKMSFNQIYGGSPPKFDTTKKSVKSLNGKKTKQESLHKFLTKTNNVVTNGNNSVLLERMKKREEELMLMKKQKKEEEAAIKQKRKEENLLIAGELKNWYKPKEDLELIDQKKLPTPTPIRTKIPAQYFGDVLMFLDFVHSFSKLLYMKDFFSTGLTIEIMERALIENEVAGPFVDIIQMLLTALFSVQDEEASQYKTEVGNPSLMKQEEGSDKKVQEAVRLATLASTWTNKHHGLPLSKVPLYSLTTSEILRLHLLSSGALINSVGARWRYQQRGGYGSEDDPGLHFRLQNPQIMKALEIRNVVELPIGDKLKILSCLIDQLLTYADVRDIVEERMEKIKQAKNDYKAMLAVERKREQEFITAKCRLRKEEKDNPKASEELARLEAETERKKQDNEFKLNKLLKASHDKQVLMGTDRAFRLYFKTDSVPGFFISAENNNAGTCLSDVTIQNPALVNADRKGTIEHIRQILTETSTSDKENSPSKSPKKTNGVRTSLLQQTNENCDELMMCSTDPSNCIVHSTERQREIWSFYHSEEQLHELIDSLNKRGIRESELLQNLTNNKEEIENVIPETPTSYLNFEVAESENKLRDSKKITKNRYEDANLGYPPGTSTENILHNTLVDNVLEMEEKIYAGNLGSLLVEDRDKWRNALQNRKYEELDKTIVKEDNTKKDEENEARSRSTSPDTKPEIDPLRIPVTESSLTQSSEMKEAIRSLAIALVQVGQSVERKYLKKPLGRMYGSKTDKNSMLEQWEKSLLVSTSFSQIFLHYSTLDSCVMWARSVLLARCRVCRRQNDSENMLLCDSCNLGHHLYCLKPKLKSIPSGDWYCNKCQNERKKQEAAANPEPPAKKRPIFIDEEIEEEKEPEEEKQQEESDEGEDLSNADENGDVEDEEETKVPVKLCETCGSGGELITCEKCSICYHIECVDPPLRRPPRGSWFCSACKDKKKRRHDKYYYNGGVVQRSAVTNGQRRCAAKALDKIHNFAKSLRRLSESDDSSEEEVISKRSARRDEIRTDLPLHNSALHEVLSEVMKDSNAWPFVRPVQKNEVPDYYDVITKPMDFGTIKYKLNMGEYTEDAQFMTDALLVFQNCNTYNHTEDDVYKCGVELQKHFQKKCKEVGLKLPEELDYDDDNDGGMSARSRKKMRTK